MSGENEGTSEKDKNNEQLNLKVIGQDGEIVQWIMDNNLFRLFNWAISK